MRGEKDYKRFVNQFENLENPAPFRYCGCAVPRNDNGWPTIKPESMDDMQVFYEASRWRTSAFETGPHTVSGSLWTQYTDELIRRGLMDADSQRRYDLRKIMHAGWRDLPPGPVIVDPVIAPPIQVDPKQPSIAGRTARAVTSALRRILPKNQQETQ